MTLIQDGVYVCKTYSLRTLTSGATLLTSLLCLVPSTVYYIYGHYIFGERRNQQQQQINISNES